MYVGIINTIVICKEVIRVSQAQCECNVSVM